LGFNNNNNNCISQAKKCEAVRSTHALFYLIITYWKKCCWLC